MSSSRAFMKGMSQEDLSTGGSQPTSATAGVGTEMENTGAPTGRAFVTNLTARAGSGAGVGRDRGRVVVGLDLHQDVDQLVRVAVLPGGWIGHEARALVAFDDRGVVLVRR